MKRLILTVTIIGIISTLSGCKKNSVNYNKAEHTEQSIKPDSISSINNTIEFPDESKLNFDNAIIGVTEINDVYSLKLERMTWNKSELTSGVKKAIQQFSGEQVFDNDFKFDYLDEIDGPQGEEIERNFYALSVDTKTAFYRYQHFSCFLIARMKSGFNFDEAITENGYFDELNNNELAQDAENWMNVLSSDYNSFFSIDKYEMYPFYYEKNDYGCKYRYGVKYKGVPFDTNYYAAIDPDENLSVANNFAEAALDNDNKLCSFTSYYNWIVTENNEYTEIISFENACNKVNESISDKVMFDVTRADFVYKINEVNDENNMTLYWQTEPCWKITIDRSGIAEYPRLAFLVNAVTGELYTYAIAL